jgi:holo-[acyl-carrier protein] synthase
VSRGGSPPLAAVLTGAVGELIATSGLSGAVVGVGVDAVDLDRFRRVLGRRAHLADRLFTAGERAYAAAASDPVPRLSTRFAAKEATMKALGVGLGAFAFAEVEVVRSGLGAPWLVLHGSALERAGAAGVWRWHLSLTHTERVAMALVVAEGGGDAGPPGPEPMGPARRSTGPAPKP